MQPCDFVEFHGAALETNEARHNVILAILVRAVSDPDLNVRLWSLGTTGQSAVQTPGRPIVLGDLDQAQSSLLAETGASPRPPLRGGPQRTPPEARARAWRRRLPLQAGAECCGPRAGCGMPSCRSAGASDFEPNRI
jgi:hypothetical protein